jgi:hypothetical protein
MEVVLELTIEKTEYMLMSRHQNAGKYYNMKITNRAFENASEFRYLGMTVKKSKFNR